MEKLAKDAQLCLLVRHALTTSRCLGLAALLL